MDLNNPVIKLCMEGTRAEFEGRLEEARALFMRAWEASKDDFDACVSAHYMARFQEEPEEILRWNQEALNRAKAVGDDSVKDFYPSLYLNLGHAYELLGNQAEAKRYYRLAAALGAFHQAGGHNQHKKSSRRTPSSTTSPASGPCQRSAP
jgi:tetratricopeptide (TPR) repeat protein